MWKLNPASITDPTPGAGALFRLHHTVGGREHLFSNEHEGRRVLGWPCVESRAIQRLPSISKHEDVSPLHLTRKAFSASQSHVMAQ